MLISCSLSYTMEPSLDQLNTNKVKIEKMISRTQKAIRLSKRQGKNTTTLEGNINKLNRQLKRTNRAIKLAEKSKTPAGPVTPPTPAAAGDGGYTVVQLTNMWQTAYNHFAGVFASGNANDNAQTIYEVVTAVVDGDTAGVPGEPGVAIDAANRQQAEEIKMIVDAGIDSLAGRGIDRRKITELVGAPDNSNLGGSFRELMDRVIDRLKRFPTT